MPPSSQAKPHIEPQARLSRRVDNNLRVHIHAVLRALTPLFWGHVNPCGRFGLDRSAHIAALA